MSLKSIREALRDVIQAEYPEGWRVYPHLAAVTQSPAIIIQPSTDVEIPSAAYKHGFGNTTLWYLDLSILLPYKKLDASTELLDKMVSTDGLPYLMNVRNRPVLKDVFKTLKVTKMRDYGGDYVTNGEVHHIGAVIKLEAEEQCL